MENKNKNKIHPVCKIMRSFLNEYVKYHFKHINKEIKDNFECDAKGYIQEPIINYISIVFTSLIYFAKNNYPEILIKQQIKNTKINNNVIVIENDCKRKLKGKLINKTKDFIMVSVNEINERTVFEYNRRRYSHDVTDEEREREKEMLFKISNIKKII